MKRLILLLGICGLLYLSSKAQYCGNNSLPNPPYGNPSGSSVCTPSGTLSPPGFTPTDSLPPMINGMESTTVIQFKNFDTVSFGNQYLTMQWLKIDSIGNLPAQVCWSTNTATNKYMNSESGCIKINGTPCSSPGQYRLKIFITPFFGFPLENQPVLTYYLRVKNQGDLDTPVDTTGQTAGTNTFVSYNETTNCATAVNDLSSSINTLSINPNPFNNKSIVSFYSNITCRMSESLSNVIGGEVLRKNIEVSAGVNASVIERKNLPPGLYFYSLSDGKSLVTRKVIIAE